MAAGLGGGSALETQTQTPAGEPQGGGGGARTTKLLRSGEGVAPQGGEGGSTPSAPPPSALTQLPVSAGTGGSGSV